MISLSADLFINTINGADGVPRRLDCLHCCSAWLVYKVSHNIFGITCPSDQLHCCFGPTYLSNHLHCFLSHASTKPVVWAEVFFEPSVLLFGVTYTSSYLHCCNVYRIPKDTYVVHSFFLKQTNTARLHVACNATSVPNVSETLYKLL